MGAQDIGGPYTRLGLQHLVDVSSPTSIRILLWYFWEAQLFFIFSAQFLSFLVLNIGINYVQI